MDYSHHGIQCETGITIINGYSVKHGLQLPWGTWITVTMGSSLTRGLQSPWDTWITVTIE